MSAINPAYPATGAATTQSVRDNFQAAADELDAAAAALGILLPNAYNAPPPPKYNPTPGGFVLPCVNTSQSLSSTAITPNRLYCNAFRAPGPMYLSKLALRITTASPGYIRVGLYTNDGLPTRYPKDLIFDTGPMSTNTTGLLTYDLDTSLTDGALYHVVSVADNAVTLYYQGTPHCPPMWYGGPATIAGPACLIYSAFPFAALPLDLTGQSWSASNANSPAVGFNWT